jgi:hypothetical protein
LVTPGGTAVPLPNDAVVCGFAVNGNATAFTAEVTGVYLVSYSVTLPSGVALVAGITRNGAYIPASVVSDVSGSNVYTCSFLLSLQQNDVLTLSLSALHGDINLQGEADLTIIRLS